TGGTTGTSTPTTAPTPTSGTGTDTPSPTVDWQGFEPEVQEQLTEMYESGEDTREVEQLMLDALEASDAGDDEKAVSLMDRARERLRELVLKARSSKASFTWWYALGGLLIIIVVSVYYSSTSRKKPPSDSGNVISLPPGAGNIGSDNAPSSSAESTSWNDVGRFPSERSAQ
ncbi:hypothetical protein KJ765_03940, partial [Candidatus Micrarchaeota archaeon]|nr:hypothetical protein [Candidatus Micrarchaeota archaeon]